MSVAKIYNSGTGQWEPAVLGAQGPTGPTGPTGPQGPTGPTDLPITTQGDLIVGDSLGDAARLAVGASGSLLYSDGTSPSWLTNSGTEGDVLQVNASGGLEFATPGGGGGSTLLSTTTLTGASVSITSIPDTYKDLKLVIRGFTPDTDGSTLRFSLNGSTGNHIRAIENTGVSPTDFFSTSALSRPTDDTVQTSAFVIEIFDYANTSTWKTGKGLSIVPDSTDPNKFGFRDYILATNITSAISSIQLFLSAGNFSAGTALLYGVN